MKHRKRSVEHYIPRLFAEILQFEEYLTWLNPKGIRESNLKSTLDRWKSYIIGGMQARHKVRAWTSYVDHGAEFMLRILHCRVSRSMGAAVKVMVNYERRT
jgi:Williams-Beuren syndrome DDT (WSD), D-TOX E motif